MNGSTHDNPYLDKKFDQSCFPIHFSKVVIGQSMPACPHKVSNSPPSNTQEKVWAYRLQIFSRQQLHTSIIPRVVRIRIHVRHLDAQVLLSRPGVRYHAVKRDLLVTRLTPFFSPHKRMYSSNPANVPAHMYAFPGGICETAHTKFPMSALMSRCGTTLSGRVGNRI